MPVGAGEGKLRSVREVQNESPVSPVSETVTTTNSRWPTPAPWLDSLFYLLREQSAAVLSLLSLSPLGLRRHGFQLHL